MCGIVGIFNDPASLSRESLTAMMGLIQYRGPDEAGLYLDETAGLGHVRLSIFDLAGGAQPIHNGSKSLWIVYNGEIFNFPELRTELKTLGHRFYTTTDTEVLLHAYEEYGEGCLTRFNGQFAFAIWDVRKKELFLARDRVGIRPLHYYRSGGSFYFASEIKALFALPSVPRELNPGALDEIFSYWTPLPGNTPFKGIRELKPGHCMRVTANGAEEKPYWTLPAVEKADCEWKSPDRISEEIRELLMESIRLRLRADVPVGSYLSGGLDSSIIASLVSRNFNNQIDTFGVRFEQAEFDEGSHQKRMVDHLGVNHHEITADNLAIGRNFEDVVWHAEKPLTRMGPVPLFLLSRFVRESGLKVVLTGEGADEVFGGYNIFREALIRTFWSRFPGSKMRSSLIERLYPYIFRNELMRKSSLGFFAQGLNDASNPYFSHQLRWRNTARIKSFFKEGVLSGREGPEFFRDLAPHLPADFERLPPLTRAQVLETSLFMSNYLLSSQGDRVAAAHSIEIRVPFLDHRIIEYMSKIPPIWKILGIDEKYLLKRTFKADLPAETTSRSKHPYRAPIQQSILNPGNEALMDALSPANLQETGWFKPDRVRRLIQKFESGRAVGEVDNMALVGILSTQILHRQYVADFKANQSTRSKDPELKVMVDARPL